MKLTIGKGEIAKNRKGRGKDDNLIVIPSGDTVSTDKPQTKRM